MTAERPQSTNFHRSGNRLYALTMETKALCHELPGGNIVQEPRVCLCLFEADHTTPMEYTRAVLLHLGSTATNGMEVLETRRWG